MASAGLFSRKVNVTVTRAMGMRTIRASSLPFQRV